MAVGTPLWSGKSATGTPRMAQMQGYSFWVNGAEKDAPWKVASDGTVLAWGLAAPTDAQLIGVSYSPTFYDGPLTRALGADGQFEYKYSWYRSTDGYESPASNAKSLADVELIESTIKHTGLPSHADTNVHLRIYRKNPTGTMFRRVGTGAYDVAHGTTTYTDGTSEELNTTYGDEPTNHVSPTKADNIIAHNAVVWLLGIYNADQSKVRRDMFQYSLSGEPDYFPYIESVPTRMGDIVAGAVHGYNLLILCERGTLKVQGVSANIEIFQKGDSVGCLSAGSVCNVLVPGLGDVVVWLSHGQVSLFAGGDIMEVSHPIRKTLDGFTNANLKVACASVNTLDATYCLFVADATAKFGYRSLTWWFNQPGRPWTVTDGPPFCAATAYRGQDFGDIVIGGDPWGQLHIYNSTKYSWSAFGYDFNQSGTTIEGTATGGGAAGITDTGAGFYNTGAKLANLFVSVEYANGAYDTKRISANDGTSITAVSNFSSTIAAGTKYYVGGIVSYFTTPPMNLGDDTVEKRAFWLHATMKNTAVAGQTITVIPYYNYSDTGGTTVTLDATQPYQRKSLTGRFRQVAWSVRHIASASQMNLRSMAVSVLPALEARQP